jgi:ABC-type uncharacterized transport system involved in gliding motility auxiliary subunit
MSMAEATHEKVETPSSNNKALGTVGRLLGAIGMVLLCSTPLTYLLTDDWGALVWGKLALGVLFVAVYLATNADVFGRAAGARSTGLLAISGGTVVLVVGLLGVVNYIAYKNPKEFDLSREGIYTLSDQTLGVLGRLTDEVKIYAFFAPQEPSYGTVQETLARYKTHAPKLSYEMIDPQSRPDLVEKYTITEQGARIVITARGQDARAKMPSEEELTNGIVRVAEQTSKTIYFLTGHGESDIDDAQNPEGYKPLADAIRAEGYTVEKLNLLEGTSAAAGAQLKVEPGAGDAPPKGLEIPSKVSVLVIAGAKKPLLPPEVTAVEEFLKKGGRVIALLEPDSDAGLGTLLAQWKIEPQKDLVVDTNQLNRMLGLGPAAPIVQPPQDQQQHAVTKTMQLPAIMFAARSLKVAAGGMPGVDAVTLLEAGESAWGETALKDGSAALDDKDNKGPVPVAIAAVKPVGEPNKLSDEGRLFVAGDSEWVNGKYLSLQGNGDFILNVVNWLAEEQAKIAIRPKTRQASQVFLTGEQMGQLKFVALDILPVLLVAVGLGIVLIRRQR